MARKQKFNAYRDGFVHICKSICKTCIYRPGSPLMDIPIKAEAVKNNNAVICHSTLKGQGSSNQAVCRGFYENDRTPLLRLADHFGIVKLEVLSTRLHTILCYLIEALITMNVWLLQPVVYCSSVLGAER